MHYSRDGRALLVGLVVSLPSVVTSAKAQDTVVMRDWDHEVWISKRTPSKTEGTFRVKICQTPTCADVIAEGVLVLLKREIRGRDFGPYYQALVRRARTYVVNACYKLHVLGSEDLFGTVSDSTVLAVWGAPSADSIRVVAPLDSLRHLLLTVSNTSSRHHGTAYVKRMTLPRDSSAFLTAQLDYRGRPDLKQCASVTGPGSHDSR